MAEAIFGQNSRLSLSASTVLHPGTWNKPQRRAAAVFSTRFMEGETGAPAQAA
jgi:hypothetical protein